MSGTQLQHLLLHTGGVEILLLSELLINFKVAMGEILLSAKLDKIVLRVYNRRRNNQSSLGIKAGKEPKHDMEMLLQQAEVRLRSHRHHGGNLASFQSGYYSGSHQQSDYASFDEPSCYRGHSLGNQTHGLRRSQEEGKVAPTKLRLRGGPECLHLGLLPKYF